MAVSLPHSHNFREKKKHHHRSRKTRPSTIVVSSSEEYKKSRVFLDDKTPTHDSMIPAITRKKTVKRGYIMFPTNDPSIHPSIHSKMHHFFYLFSLVKSRSKVGSRPSFSLLLLSVLFSDLWGRRKLPRVKFQVMSETNTAQSMVRSQESPGGQKKRESLIHAD